MTSLQVCSMCMYMLSHTPAHHHWTGRLYTSLFYLYFYKEKVKFCKVENCYIYGVGFFDHLLLQA